LDGGPKRVNHAAVAIGDIIYSFGGFCSGTDFKQLDGIDVHAFNTRESSEMLISGTKNTITPSVPCLRLFLFWTGLWV
jgi:hypothetical protein